MSTRFAPAIAATIAILAVAACSGTVAPAPAVTAAPSAPLGHAPNPTPVPVPPAATPEGGSGQPSEEPTEQPNTGEVDGSGGGPQLTVVAVDEDTIQATIDDPAAKAWRLVIAGTGERGSDRWEIRVETGDVGPAISATEVVDGKVVDEMDLSGFGDGTAAAGGCHSTLAVCLDSDGFKVPDGDGSFSLRLDLPQGQVPLLLRGGTARWDGEPFILGAWHDTTAFSWGEG
jgi:hypothetical protein